MLRTAGTLADGAFSSYRRVFSKVRWSPIRLACVLARRIVAFLPADAEVVLVADDTVFSHVPEGPSIQKLPPSIREILYTALAPVV